MGDILLFCPTMMVAICNPVSVSYTHLNAGMLSFSGYAFAHAYPVNSPFVCTPANAPRLSAGHASSTTTTTTMMSDRYFVFCPFIAAIRYDRQLSCIRRLRILLKSRFLVHSSSRIGFLLIFSFSDALRVIY